MSASDPPPRPQRSFAARFFAALRLDAALFEEVEADPRALGQAAVVVGLAGLSRGVGAFATDGGVGLVGSPLIGFLVWVLSAAVIYLIGVRSFGYTSDFRELLRTLGFAAAPLVGLSLCALPLGPGSTPLWVAVHAVAIYAFMIAVREALDVATDRALWVCLLALAMSLLVLFLLGLLLVGSGASKLL